MSSVPDFMLDRHLDDLRGIWQGRVLAEVKGPFHAVILSVLAHNYEDAIVTLCAAVLPGFNGSIPAPHLTSAARIAKSGAIVADVVDRDGIVRKDTVIFLSETQMRDTFRKCADRLKLDDRDRIEFFKCAQRWVTADRRLDPTMDPQDPDAKRLVH